MTSAAPVASAPYLGDDAFRSRLDAEENEPLTIGYPVITETVEGTPVFAFYPPPTPPPRRQRYRCRCIPRCCGSFACLSAFLLLLIGAAAFFVWPRDINISVVDMSIGKVYFNIDKSYSVPQVSINITLYLQLQAENSNYFEFTYDEIAMSIFFQGDEFGEALADGGVLESLQTSSIDATLELNGEQISSNIVSLIADIAERAVPLQTVTAFDGYINVIWFALPVEGKITCDIVVDPVKQALLTQTCS